MSASLLGLLPALDLKQLLGRALIPRSHFRDGRFATQGADTVLPFACPADHFLPMKHLDNATQVDVPYRMTGFLSAYEQACAQL